MKKGFTLIELLAVIVILAIIALIVTPVVSNIVANARIAANARSVEGQIRNIELAIISEAFAGETTGDLDSYDTITSGATIESSLSRPGNDNVTCTSYTIKHGTVLSASGCKDNENKWGKVYTYSNSEGAVVFEFKGTVIWPGLDSNGNPTQNKISNTMSLPMADSEGNSIVTYLGIIYMDPTNLKTICNSNNTNVTSKLNNIACKKFYIYKDTGYSYIMILDRNTTYNVKWISKEDYLTAGGTETEWGTKGNNTKGPITALKQLAIDTKGWIGNPRMITADEIAHIVGADREDTIKWSSSLPYSNTVGTQSAWFYLDGGRNSDPTTYSSSDGWQHQYAKITNKSNFSWLYDYVTKCVDNGCYIDNGASYSSSGYWTFDDVVGEENRAYLVLFKGTLQSNQVDATYYGIRPVLEIPKSLIG